MNVGPDVLHQVVMNDDLLSKPIELTAGIHASGLHRVEAFNSWHEAETVHQRPSACSGEIVLLEANTDFKAWTLSTDRFNDRVAPDRQFDVTLTAAVR